MSFESICPHCNKNIKIDQNSPPQPRFSDPREQIVYNKRRMEAQKRGKECFVCPDCKGELTVFRGKLFKLKEMGEEIYNKVFCSFCGKELDFRICYKEIKTSAVEYTFYCKKCAEKNVIRWLVLIVFVVIISLIIIYFV